MTTAERMTTDPIFAAKVYARVREIETMKRLWDSISGKLSCDEMEKRFIALATANGIDAETAEGFLFGGDI